MYQYKYGLTFVLALEIFVKIRCQAVHRIRSESNSWSEIEVGPQAKCRESAGTERDARIAIGPNVVGHDPSVGVEIPVQPRSDRIKLAALDQPAVDIHI